MIPIIDSLIKRNYRKKIDMIKTIIVLSVFTFAIYEAVVYEPIIPMIFLTIFTILIAIVFTIIDNLLKYSNISWTYNYIVDKRYDIETLIGTYINHLLTKKNIECAYNSFEIRINISKKKNKDVFVYHLYLYKETADILPDCIISLNEKDIIYLFDGNSL